MRHLEPVCPAGRDHRHPPTTGILFSSEKWHGREYRNIDRTKDGWIQSPCAHCIYRINKRQQDNHSERVQPLEPQILQYGLMAVKKKARGSCGPCLATESPIYVVTSAISPSSAFLQIYALNCAG